MKRLALFLAIVLAAGSAWAEDRVTVLYDSFGVTSGLRQDWGFSLLVQHGGKRILFDAGNDAETFRRNVRLLKVDLKKLDAVVISHRHGDHIAGIPYILKVNPSVPIYAPKEAFGIFGGESPANLYRSVEELPRDMRYFSGARKGEWKTGPAWPDGNFRTVDAVTEILPGVAVVPTVSETTGTLEMRELTLRIETPQGLVLFSGCSHAGIEKILAAAASDKHIHALFGGLHLVKASDTEVQRIAVSLHDRWKPDFIAPGHCTGEPAFAALKRLFGDQYLYAGLGSVITIR